MKAATTANGKASDWMVPLFLIYDCARTSHIFTVSAGVSQLRVARHDVHKRTSFTRQERVVILVDPDLLLKVELCGFETKVFVF